MAIFTTALVMAILRFGPKNPTACDSDESSEDGVESNNAKDENFQEGCLRVASDGRANPTQLSLLILLVFG